MHSFDEQLAGRFPAYASFPDTATLGLLDMIYNLGAAANCYRVGPSQARNDWTRQQFLAAAAIDPGSNPATALADPATAA